MKRRAFGLGLAVVLVLLLALSACQKATPAPAGPATPAPAVPATPAPTPEVIKLKFQAAWPTGLTLYDNFKEWAALVDEMSAGRLQIETLPAGAVVPAFEVQEATSKGVIDGFHSAMGYLVGKSRAGIPLSHGPMFGMDFQDYLGWYYYGGGKELTQEWYRDVLKWNVVSIPVLPAGPQALGWFSKEIRSLDDIVGMKYRIYGIGAEVYGKLGVSVVTLPGAEILPALERGVLDGAEWVGGIEDLRLGFQDVVKIHYTPGMHEPITIGDVGFNKDVWDKLSPDLQAIVESAATTTFWRWAAYWEKQNADAYRELVDKHGVKVFKTPDSILYKFLQVYDEISAADAAKDPFYKKVIESQKKWAGLVVPYRMSAWPEYDFRGKYYWEDEMFLK